MFLAAWIPLLALLFLIAAWPLGARASEDPCRGGRPRERMTVFLSHRFEQPGKGLPLDDALTAERDASQALRVAAARYFDFRDERVRRLRERFTFLFPERVAEFYGVDVPVAVSPSALALRYRELLWKHYLERFTSVEEAHGRDAYSTRYKVSLDLTLFCRYRQNVNDLVAR